jgi:hypothetical protein
VWLRRPQLYTCLLLQSIKIGEKNKQKMPKPKKQKQKCEPEPVVVGNPTTPIISKLGSKSIISNLGLT